MKEPIERGYRRVTLERPVTIGHLVHEHTEREEIGALIDRFSQRLLG